MNWDKLQTVSVSRNPSKGRTKIACAQEIALLAIVICGAARAGTDQGVLFGETLPKATILYAFAEENGYAIYAVTNDTEWPQEQNGESWQDYVVRVNEQQNLPRGVWIAEDIRRDWVADDIANVRSQAFVLWLGTNVLAEHWVGRGTFYGPAGAIPHVVAWLNKTTREDTEFSVTSFWAVGIASSEEEALSLMGRRRVPFVGNDSSGCKIVVETSPWDNVAPLLVTFKGCGGTLPIPTGGSSASSSQRFGGLETEAGPVLRSITDPTVSVNEDGVTCLVEHNICTTHCDRDFVSNYTGCETQRWIGYGGAGAACVGLAFLNPAAGLACAAAAMFVDVVVTYVCRETEFDSRDVCHETCRQAWGACCQQAGVICGV